MEEEILKGINFEADSGKIYSIAGPNGSGKTSFMESIIIIINMPDMAMLVITIILAKLVIQMNITISNGVNGH